MSKKKADSDPIEVKDDVPVVQQIAKEVIEILKPQLKEFGDSLKDMIQNEVNAVRQEIEAKVGSPKVAVGGEMNDMMGTIKNVLSGLGMDPNMINKTGGDPSQGGQPPNPLAALMGGGGGQIGMLMELLKMFGIGSTQQNPMVGLMNEMMYKNMLAQQYRQSALMDSIVASFIKNPDKLSEYMATQQVLVRDPVEMVAKVIQSGQQGNINPNTK